MPVSFYGAFKDLKLSLNLAPFYCTKQTILGA